MFNPAYFENSRSDGFGALEVLGGLEPADRDASAFVPLQKSILRGEITGPLADLRLTQRFAYRAEECDKVLEAAYRFPLPGDAAVRGVSVRFGDVKIVAELKPRAEAEAAYAAAKEADEQAALVSRESPDVFTLLVAGIRPGEPVEVETAYVQLARSAGLAWRLRAPLTTAPRYVRMDELNAAHAKGQPLTILRVPGHRFELDVIMRDAAQVESPTHPLAVEKMNVKGEERLRVTLADGAVLPDRDFVLAWRPRQAERLASLSLRCHRDEATDQVYFLAAVTPPARPPATKPILREMILLLDHSGSMQGPKWAAADWAMERFLRELTSDDRFALAIFHTHIRWFDPGIQTADPETVDAAVAWLKESRDSGGTELGVALEQALHLPRSEDDLARHVVIVTDAAVTDAGRILRLVDEETRRSPSRRISVLCIDAAPNAYLANAMAERGGGVAKFLTSEPSELDITTALEEALAFWAAPLLTGLRLSADRKTMASDHRPASHERTGWSALDLGDLPGGQMRWVCGRAPGAGRPRLQAELSADREGALAAADVDLARLEPMPALKALFGAHRINELEYLIHAGYDRETLAARLDELGYDGQTVMTTVEDQVYAENQRRAVAEALRGLLVEEAMNYSLPSSETSFVAVRHEAGEPVEMTVPVANALPSGWPHPMMPRTAGRIRSKGDFLQAAAASYAPSPMPDLKMGEGGPAMAPRLQPSFMPGPTPDSRRTRAGRPQPGGGECEVFAGEPLFQGGKATLFDSSRDPDPLPAQGALTQIRVEFLQPGKEGVPGTVRLLIFVGDLAEPRAVVRLADLARYGARPLNIARQPGDVVRVELAGSEKTKMNGEFTLWVTVR
jgi:Ca-activated chloride channel family protein